MTRVGVLIYFDCADLLTLSVLDVVLLPDDIIVVICLFQQVLKLDVVVVAHVTHSLSWLQLDEVFSLALSLLYCDGVHLVSDRGVVSLGKSDLRQGGRQGILGGDSSVVRTFGHLEGMLLDRDIVEVVSVLSVPFHDSDILDMLKFFQVIVLIGE